MQTIMFKMDKQQDPTVQHRELYLIASGKPEWKSILKSVHIYTH